jgi:hypothetical protein
MRHGRDLDPLLQAFLLGAAFGASGMGLFLLWAVPRFL